MRLTFNHVTETPSTFVPGSIYFVGGGEESSKILVANSETEYIDYITPNVQKLITNTALKFFCIEPVTVRINEDTFEYTTNTLVDLELKTTDDFEIITTSDKSILGLYGWPKALDYFYPWLEGVQVFDSIVFDMNSQEMYTKWNQGNQGLYHVQKAQYVNCVFWSDNPYINDVAIRTNYTLYNSFQLPLCYSTIPANTFKPFYLAYGAKNDPNWG